MDELLTLEDVSAQTGVSIRRLREWCATGRVTCERDGRAWMVPTSELERIRSLADERTRPTDDGHPVAIVVPVETAPPDLADEVARRLGLAPATVAMSNLAIDGQAYVVAVWKDGDGAGGLPEVAQLAEEVGGELLEGSVPQRRIDSGA